MAMLRSISWDQYFAFLASAVFAWYLILLIRYAAKRGMQKAQEAVMGSRSDMPGMDGQSESTPANAEQIDYAENPEWGLLTQTVTQDIKTMMAEGAKDGIANEEMRARLQVILSNYPHLRHTAYGIAINDMIRRQAAAYGFSLDRAAIPSCWD
jgi:hypothetical protein